MGLGLRFVDGLLEKLAEPCPVDSLHKKVDSGSWR